MFTAHYYSRGLFGEMVIVVVVIARKLEQVTISGVHVYFCVCVCACLFVCVCVHVHVCVCVCLYAFKGTSEQSLVEEQKSREHHATHLQELTQPVAAVEVGWLVFGWLVNWLDDSRITSFNHFQMYGPVDFFVFCFEIFCSMDSLMNNAV
jgi:hypothetical protein